MNFHITVICFSDHSQGIGAQSSSEGPKLPLCSKPPTMTEKWQTTPKVRLLQYLIKNLLLPLFAISKGEKKQGLDRLLTVSTYAIVTEKRNTELETEFRAL
jgi:hypothetical protein